MKEKMLNLEIGKIYHITDFIGIHHTFKVNDKTVHSEGVHSYFGTWPDEDRGYDVCRYFWDKGAANQGRTLVFDIYSIKTCEEVASYGRVDSN